MEDIENNERGKKKHLAKWTLAALGVVFGDIGTSPLYAIKECFSPVHGIPLTEANVLGVLSLIFWSLTLVVSVKYLVFILRADNRGEGGIMALTALLLPREGILTFLGLFGAALLYGDGVITPAISVLSAIEGLEIAEPAMVSYVVPATVSVLIALFTIQKRGTARIGSIFGPAMLAWFLTIALIGLPWIIERPEILGSLHPAHALSFFLRNGTAGWLVLSAVVLCITGAEALYADIGHFGKRPIRAGWFAIAFPALLTNYLGQGAVILARGAEAARNPFYSLAPGWALLPLVFLATAATVIASQALITGAYSLTQQAIQLGYFPRTRISHTSRETAGQIYVARVNHLLMLGCVFLVVAFRSSRNLAAAYGVAVTGTMMITSLLYYSVLIHQWNWARPKAGALAGIFLVVDAGFFLANAQKIGHGGWIPLVIAASLFTLMTTWKRGRGALSSAIIEQAQPLDQFLRELPRWRPSRVHGTAVFMTLTQDIAPSVLLHHLRHNHILHETILLLSIFTQNQPKVAAGDRVRIEELPHGFFKVIARYGYMEQPDVSEILIHCLDAGLAFDPNDLSFFLGRESFVPNGTSPMSPWRKRLFVVMARNSRPATDYFGLPPDQVIEIGSQVLI